MHAAGRLLHRCKVRDGFELMNESSIRQFEQLIWHVSGLLRDQSAWEELTTVVREPAEPGFFNIEILDDCENAGATVEKLMGALVGGYEHSFMVVADGVSISQPDHPLLVVDLVVERGRQFRAAAHAAKP